MGSIVENSTISSIQLEWRDDDGLITVTPQDQDRFNIKLSRAIDALQQADKEDQFADQFKLLLKVLAAWLKPRTDIRDAYLTLRDGGLSFVVVKNLPQYDEQYEDELSDLDFRIANDVDLDLIKLDVIGLPAASEESLRVFFDPNFLFTYAKSERK